ncbi:MAG: hypothetical protein AAGF12_13105 [Myxococcota bacterium]
MISVLGPVRSGAGQWGAVTLLSHEHEPTVVKRATLVLLREGSRTVSLLRPEAHLTPNSAILVRYEAQVEDPALTSTAVVDQLLSYSAPRVVAFSGGEGCAVPTAPASSPTAPADGTYELALLRPASRAALVDILRTQGLVATVQDFEPIGRDTHFVFARRRDTRAEASPPIIRVVQEQRVLRAPVGPQGLDELVLFVVARQQRYAPAAHVTIPTNLVVHARTWNDAPAFYRTLLRDTARHHPGAAITEFAGQRDRPLDGSTLDTLGATLLPSARPEGPARADVHSVRAVVGRVDVPALRSGLRDLDFPRCANLSSTGELQVTADLRANGSAARVRVRTASRNLHRCIEEELRRLRPVDVSRRPSTISFRLAFRRDRRTHAPEEFAVSRLRFLFGDRAPNAIELRPAPGIRGGEGQPVDRELRSGAQPAGRNRFFARYAIVPNSRQCPGPFETHRRSIDAFPAATGPPPADSLDPWLAEPPVRPRVPRKPATLPTMVQWIVS